MGVADTFRNRTFLLATGIVGLVRDLPPEWYARELGRQLLRAGTSVGANYRAACRGRSRREFVAKLGVAVEEADETVFWLDLISAAGLKQDASLRALQIEAQEILAILSRSYRTAKANAKRPG